MILILVVFFVSSLSFWIILLVCDREALGAVE